LVLYGGGVCAIETGGGNDAGCGRGGKVEPYGFQTGQDREQSGR